MKRTLTDEHARILMAAIDAQPLGDSDEVDAEIVNACKGKGLGPNGTWLNIEPADAQTYEIDKHEVRIPKMPGFPGRWQWKQAITLDLDATQAKLCRGWVEKLKGEKSEKTGKPLLTKADAPVYRELVDYLADCTRGAEVRNLDSRIEPVEVNGTP